MAAVHASTLFCLPIDEKYSLGFVGILLAGMFHQLTFAWYSGGFLSSITVWVAVLPLFAGIVAGARAAIIWAVLTSLAGLLMMVAQLSGMQPPLQQISQTGQWVAQSFLVFGWIVLNTLSVLSVVWLWDQRRQRIDEQRAHAETLFRGLFHDLVSPINSLEDAIVRLRQSDGANPEILLNAADLAWPHAGGDRRGAEYACGRAGKN